MTLYTRSKEAFDKLLEEFFSVSVSHDNLLLRKNICARVIKGLDDLSPAIVSAGLMAVL